MRSCLFGCATTSTGTYPAARSNSTNLRSRRFSGSCMKNLVLCLSPSPFVTCIPLSAPRTESQVMLSSSALAPAGTVSHAHSGKLPKFNGSIERTHRSSHRRSNFCVLTTYKMFKEWVLPTRAASEASVSHLLLTALLVVVAHLASMTLYAAFIVPRLSEVTAVPFLWWLCAYAPLFFALFRDWRSHALLARCARQRRSLCSRDVGGALHSCSTPVPRYGEKHSTGIATRILGSQPWYVVRSLDRWSWDSLGIPEPSHQRNSRGLTSEWSGRGLSLRVTIAPG